MAGGLIILGFFVLCIALAARAMLRVAELVPGTTVCRVCGFDLAALLSDARISDHFACPECGRGIAGLRDTTNRSETNLFGRVSVRIAFLVAIILIAGGSVLGLTSSKQNTWKPLWLLRIELFSRSAATQSGAAAEISSRIGAGSVTATAVDSILQDLGTRQRDPASDWNSEWSDIVIAADKSGLLTPLQLATFAKDGRTMRMLTRQQSRLGEPMRIEIVHDTTRGLRGSPATKLRWRTRLVASSVGENSTALSFPSDEGGLSGGVGTSSTTMGGPIPERLGPATLKQVWRHDIFGPLNPEKPLLSWDDTLESPVTIVGPNDPVLEIHRDEQITPSLKAAITLRQLAHMTPGSKDLLLELEWNAMPENLAFEVKLRCMSDSGQSIETSFVDVYLERKKPGRMSYLARVSKLPDCKAVDVVLRPSEAAAERAARYDTAWIGPDIVFPDVPIADRQRGF